MIHPRLVVLEPDGRLVRHLGAWPAERKVVVREFRHAAACLDALSDAPAGSVLLIRLGDEPLADLRVLATAHHRLPDVPAVVVGGADDAAALAALAWDAGAAYALFPPTAWDVLPGVLDGLLLAALPVPGAVA